MSFKNFPRTLVIQPLPGIGDLVWHIRALKAVAQTSYKNKVSLLVKTSSQASLLLGHEAYIDQIHYLDSKKHFGLLGGMELTRDLRLLDYERVWILHHSLRYYLSALQAGFPLRIGYGFGWHRHLLTSHLTLENDQKKLTPLKRLYAFFALHQINLTKISQKLTPHKAILEDLKETFKIYPRPWIALGIGATESSRMWPAYSFQKLAKILSPGRSVFLCGSKQETSLAQMIATDTSAIPMTTLPLDQTCALLSECCFFIGNDSGLLNIAASLGVPAFGLFSKSIYDYVENFYSITPELGNDLQQLSLERVIEFLKEKEFLI